MNCRVCGNPLYPGRVILQCSCGALCHSYCWDKHLLQAHEPAHELGALTLDGEFKPQRKPETGQDQQKTEVEREAVLSEKQVPILKGGS